MTLDQIRTKIREITNTTTSDYSDASLVRDVNNEIISIQTFIESMRGPMEFDDPNNTGYAIESLAITAGTDTYDIQTDEHSDNIRTVHKVIFNATDIPRLMFTEGSQEGALDATDEAKTPSGYYDLGKAIKFAQIPSESGTATIWYSREHHNLETGDTSLEPGIPRPYHALLCYKVSYNYALDKGLANEDTIRRRILEEEERLKWYEEERRGDEFVRIEPETLSGL